MDDIEALYVPEAKRSGLYSSRVARSWVWSFGAGEELQNNQRVLPEDGVIWLGDLDELPNNPKGIDFSVRRATRHAIDDFLHALPIQWTSLYGAWATPSGQLPSSLLLRNTCPQHAVTSINGPNGDVILEVCGAVRLLGSPQHIRYLLHHAASPLASQHMHLIPARGSGFAIRCARDRMLCTPTFYEAAVRILMRIENMSRSSAIRAFAALGVKQARASGFGKPQWVIWLAIPRSSVYAISGIHTICHKNGTTIMWQAAADHYCLKSLSNPTRHWCEYDNQDIAEIFVQAVLQDPRPSVTCLGQLAALQVHEFRETAHAVIGRALGPIGSPACNEYPYDLVIGTGEYEAGTFHSRAVYAWWRYCSFRRSTSPLFEPLFSDTPPVNLFPNDAEKIDFIKGPFLTMDQAGNFWSDSNAIVTKYSTLEPIVGNNIIMPKCIQQLNYNLVHCTLLMRSFMPCPLSLKNPLGGKLHLLGTFDCTTGRIDKVEGLCLTGWAVGKQGYDLVSGVFLPSTMPVMYAQEVETSYQYFEAINCGNDGNNPNPDGSRGAAPNETIYNYQWIVAAPDISTQSQSSSEVPIIWEVWSPWNVTASSPIRSMHEEDENTRSLWRSLSLWHTSIPASMEAAAITDLAASARWL